MGSKNPQPANRTPLTEEMDATTMPGAAAPRHSNDAGIAQECPDEAMEGAAQGETKPEQAHLGSDLARPPCHRHDRAITRNSMTAATPRRRHRGNAAGRRHRASWSPARTVRRRCNAVGALPNSVSDGGSEGGALGRWGEGGPAGGRLGALPRGGEGALHCWHTLGIKGKFRF
jgi:hypothetical protein